MRSTHITNRAMTVGARIRAARTSKGWTQNQLGDAVGRAQNTIASWESGRTEPTRGDVVRIASKLGIPLSQLEDIISEPRELILREIPVLSWVSAGQIAEIGSLEAAHADEQIAVADLPPGEWFATDVRGDSMDRISPDGSRIIVNVGDKRLVAGKAYIFSVRGETTFKFYQPEPVPRLEPFSTNPMNKQIFLDRDGGWSVVGRVWRSYIDLY